MTRGSKACSSRCARLLDGLSERRATACPRPRPRGSKKSRHQRSVLRIAQISGSESGPKITIERRGWDPNDSDSDIDLSDL